MQNFIFDQKLIIFRFENKYFSVEKTPVSPQGLVAENLV